MPDALPPLIMHICLGNRLSFRVELLSKAGQGGILANILQALGQQPSICEVPMAIS